MCHLRSCLQVIYNAFHCGISAEFHGIVIKGVDSKNIRNIGYDNLNIMYEDLQVSFEIEIICACAKCLVVSLATALDIRI